ncbi:hypothetical protein FHS45_003829 [Thalassobacillus devorans]|nr:hypothetical protein [Thalassobacillus devorans]
MLLDCSRTIMSLPLQAYSWKQDPSRQLAAYSVDALLVAEVLPLNYTRTLINLLLLDCSRTIMSLPLQAYSWKQDPSRQLAAYSVDALLVAEVLPLNYTRMMTPLFKITFFIITSVIKCCNGIYEFFVENLLKKILAGDISKN